MPRITTLLIANRGEIACRIMRTASALGYRTVAVYSQADADSRHVQIADQAVCIGPAPAAQSYLNIPAIIEAAQRSGAEAIHPGYGFLSENADFAQACMDAGLIFIGPSPEAIRLMGSKRQSKLAMLEAGVPCIPGYQGSAQDDATLTREAAAIGFPLMIKASAGGGGRGMRLVQDPAQLSGQLRSARAEAQSAFGSAELILERALIRPRHVEIQIFGDNHGNLVHLGERDCSVQRRHQKVIEEAPCPVVTPELRAAMGAEAVKAAASVNYSGAGTVEFMLDADGNYYFLEMNTRLQVEHPVTELVTGLDLVAWQLEVASGLPLPLRQEQIALQGHAIEVRLYAEDSRRDFVPQTGRVDLWQPANIEGVRIDHGLREGQAITAFYDPMLAKIIAHGTTREQARTRLINALEHSVLLGVNANQRFLINLLAHPQFAAGHTSTAFITEQFHSDPSLTPQPVAAEDLAMAAALLYQASARRCKLPPALQGWSNTAPIPSRFLLLNDGEVHAVQISTCSGEVAGSLNISVSGRCLHLRIIEQTGSVMVCELDGIRYRRPCLINGKRIALYCEQGNLQLEDVSHRPPAAAADVTSNRLLAPMDGAVTEVMAKVGEQVSKGQALLRMEAMKMEHTLKAQINGTISQLLASEGQQVKARQLLVEFN
ncbi:acetyl/propionyl/methylcrotonyl-CoA carboxylase subunit alpha [Halopseudomonas salina]|uniref:Geranyl-CoA carboxylase subunit alpha n=1 Tax=Halopseudomonas salina TaxID=1323744 RepID=A0ABQ1PGB8_9GAMM|nr:acetyl/propionyl/methylcrotonyl-CoA carboxylase subunit alpha [Halopseudomonas salina]GGC96725.1 geranyl-CoA carboxylase subunit alpha [Halopseudomonas salina]